MEERFAELELLDYVTRLMSQRRKQRAEHDHDHGKNK